ncbi:porin [Variovorax dokdonensis]|uniref:Porin n=1 Tax=Variovorax dokdonensis TaxID=344883 RepID=A0ABT7NF36_9BURK|nr:porin [Variovorax dokdonensis]MDM0046480.1 porin [Variovorax dokdonensis]
MKRSSLALAMASMGVAGPALAQSSVVINGLIDIGVYRDTSKTWQVGPIQRSNIAISGTEDLGGGMAATFRISTRFETDTGQLEQSDKPFFHDESTVGLKGGFGHVRLGRALDAMYAHDWKFDAWGNFDRIASPAWDIWHYNYPSDPTANNGTPDYGRINNAVFYDSPQLYGFSVHLSTAANENVRGQGARSPEQPWGATLLYTGKMLGAMASSERNSRGDEDTFFGLRGTFGDFSLYGAYDRSEDASTSSVAKAYTASAMYVMDQITFRAGFGQLELAGVRAQRTYTASAGYAFSKRTSVYVDYARKYYPDRDADMYGVGIAHSF